MVHVTTATISQIKAAFKPQPNPTPVATTSPLPTDNATKVQMVQLMSERSNMNLAWSAKCLMETNWNFDRAAFVFTELNNQNKIPAEAFAK